jgi:hypothetical protein
MERNLLFGEDEIVIKLMDNKVCGYKLGYRANECEKITSRICGSFEQLRKDLKLEQ